MSQLISRGIRELRTLAAAENLSTRTLARLNTLPTRRRTSFVAPVLVACVVAVAVAFVAPRYATAGTLESIQQAARGKVVHIREFLIEGNTRVFEREMWTDGTRFRGIEKDKLNISDGKTTVELDQGRRVAKKYASAAFANAPSGFTLDAMLDDMRKTQNLGSVQISTKLVDGRQSLVAEFSDDYSKFVLFCDEQTRLPYRVDIADKKTKRRRIMELMFRDTVDQNFFVASIPEGYRVIDLDKGFDAFAVGSIYTLERDKAKFEIYSVDINEHGDVYILFGTDHLRDVKLSLKTPYAGPLKLENAARDRRRSLVNGRQAYVWVWATGLSKMESLVLNVDLFGIRESSEPLQLTRINGVPDYFEFASERSVYRLHVTADDLRSAIKGPKSMPVINANGLEIKTTFDAVTSTITGTARNTTGVALDNIGFTYKLNNADGFTGVSIVRVGDIPAGGRVNFSQDVARIEKGSPIPVVSIEFDSIYNEEDGLSVSPD